MDSRASMAYVALGSNLGDRAAHLEAGRDSISRLPSTRILATSEIEETAPVGLLDQPMFLNQMLLVETSLPPLALLDSLQEIERSRGREREVRWGPRTLDLDIVLIEGTTVDHPRLRVPHPQLGHRTFWQREIAQLGRHK